MPALADWLARRGLGPLARRRVDGPFPQLVEPLRQHALANAAWAVLRFDTLSRILDAFGAATLPVVVFKGAALAEGAYGGIGLRPMGDVDLWTRPEDFDRAARILRQMGFETHAKETRPPALQALSGGELQFFGRGRQRGLVELHRSTFPGWWLHWTAAVDDESIWARTEPLTIDRGRFDEAADTGADPTLVRQLAPEDAVIQMAIHVAVNHQFSVAGMRGLMDVALTARARPVDWAELADRAQRWRVATAVWAVLSLADVLIGLPGSAAARDALRPSRLRRALIARFVTPASMLAGPAITRNRLRFLFQLFLVDRPRYAARLVLRSLWPDEVWMEARYGPSWSRAAHLWRFVRHGDV
jgi:hypothetical protein